MAENRETRNLRVGAMVAVALLILMAIVFLIGSEQKIFARKNEYEVQLDSVSGLAEGNPVRLSGVTIGVVKDITLPSDPNKRNVRIELMIDRKYAERIRGDSRARLKKMGLLAGDSYIDITPGSPRFPALDPGALIPAQRQTNVDQLIASGEDLVDNLVQLSYSMKNILGRVDRGEGLIGELTTNSETKQRITETLLTTLNKTNALLAHVESGKGLVGKLVYDDAYAQQLTASVSGAAANLQTVTGNVQKSLESGNGMLPALLNDPTGKKKVFDLVDNLNTTSRNLAEFSTSLQTGQGLVPRLLNDKVYGDQALNEFTSLLAQLNDTVKKINAGQGTAGKLIADPSVYESVNDILIGINESKLLRWLIRNRQQKGIEKRYATEQSTPPPATGPTPTTPVPPAPVPEVVNPATTTDTAPPPTTETAPPATTTTPPEG
jgi:phospholipid/cholesterol/gamma-HCH transport system substrate-binding protein